MNEKGTEAAAATAATVLPPHPFLDPSRGRSPRRPPVLLRDPRRRDGQPPLRRAPRQSTDEVRGAPTVFPTRMPTKASWRRGGIDLSVAGREKGWNFTSPRTSAISRSGSSLAADFASRAAQHDHEASLPWRTRGVRDTGLLRARRPDRARRRRGWACSAIRSPRGAGPGLRMTALSFDIPACR